MSRGNDNRPTVDLGPIKIGSRGDSDPGDLASDDPAESDPQGRAISVSSLARQARAITPVAVVAGPGADANLQAKERSIVQEGTGRRASVTEIITSAAVPAPAARGSSEPVPAPPTVTTALRTIGLPPTTERKTGNLTAIDAPAALREGGTRRSTKLTDTPSLRSESHLTSPAQALRYEELERMRLFIVVSLVVAVLAALAGSVMEVHRTARLVLLGGCALSLVGAAWLYRIVRNPDHYTRGNIAFGAVVVTVAAYGGVYYWGIGSPGVSLILYGIYFSALGVDMRIRLLQYLVCVVMHVGLAVAIMTGVLHDYSVLPISHLRLADQVMVVGAVQLLYLVAFLTARWSRRKTLVAIERLENAVRSVAQREAMLAEVRAELDRAIRVGGPGRYTEQVVGSFRLGVLIGRGGMGEVYEGHHVGDGSEAAVKLLGVTTFGDDKYLHRFLREAENAARLDSPHVVRVLEVGATAGELPFIAMERLRGTDLAHILRRQRRLTLEATRDMVTQVAAGLRAARLANVVHRDLKPQNVFWADSPASGRIWKLLDFGISKSTGHATLTKGSVIGTPAYMSPEQARGQAVDHRSDVYALAALTYRCVTGHPAFSGKDVPSTLHDVVYRVPTQPSLLASMPSDVDRVIALGLAKNASARFTTAEEFAECLARAVSEEGLGVRERQRADRHIEKNKWGARVTTVEE